MPRKRNPETCLAASDISRIRNHDSEKTYPEEDIKVEAGVGRAVVEQCLGEGGADGADKGGAVKKASIEEVGGLSTTL